MKIAFLGTGIMGAPMAANLIKAGFTGRGLEPHPLQDRLARPFGARVADARSTASRAPTTSSQSSIAVRLCARCSSTVERRMR